jgi:hypothetical protein
VTAIVVLAPPTAAVNVTFNEPVKLVPVIVTRVPVEAAVLCVIEVGVKLVILGINIVIEEAEVAVPPPVVTETTPD